MSLGRDLVGAGQHPGSSQTPARLMQLVQPSFEQPRGLLSLPDTGMTDPVVGRRRSKGSSIVAGELAGGCAISRSVFL